MSEKIWWYAARSGGIVAWALLAASVLVGAALASRVFASRPKPAWLLDLHRGVSGLSVVFTGVHLLGLVLDDYVDFGWLDLFVPGASSWRPGAVAWGVVAFWLLAAVQVTSLLKSRTSHRFWRRFHHLALPAYALASIHLVTAGTDASSPVLVGAVWVVSWAALALALTRLWSPNGRLPKPGRPARVSPAERRATPA